MRRGRALAKSWILLALAICSAVVITFAPPHSSTASTSLDTCDSDGGYGDTTTLCTLTFSQARDQVSSAPTAHWKLVPLCRMGEPAVCDPPQVCNRPDVGLTYALLRNGETLGSVCLTAAEKDDLFRVTGEMIVAAIADYTWRSPRLLLNPPDGRTFVNFPTIFHTDVPVQHRSLHLLGQSVLVEVAPRSYAWHPGDGADWVTSGPGSPYSPGVDVSTLNTHTYTSAAAMSALK